MSANNKHLEDAGFSIASNIFVQVSSKAFTFVLGAITLKYLQSSAILGIINVRLALLYSTLQFLSREPFRRGCLAEIAQSKLNEKQTNTKSWSRIINTIWLGFLLALFLSIPLAFVWEHYLQPSIDDLAGTNLDDYRRAVLITCLAVIIEMLLEPCFIYAQAKALTDHNPKVQFVTTTFDCITTALVVVLESNRYKAGQSSQILTKITLCHLLASTLSVVYSYGRLYKSQSLMPTAFLPSITTAQIKGKPKDLDSPILYRIFDRTSLKLSYGFLSQTFLKQALTEGERYVMTFFNVIPLSEQGIYDVISNLGSLAARLVFKPIEESGYTLFSQTVSRTEILDIRKFYRVQENLMFLIKSMLLIGLTVLTIGLNFVPLIVLYGGQKINNQLAFHLMKWELFYTPLLAVNGITECFTFAIMNTTQFNSYNLYLVFCTIIFLISTYLTQPLLGSACFMFANCLIMVSRIFFSYRMIRNYFHKHGYVLKIQDAMPSLTTFISLSGVFIFLQVSQNYLLDSSDPYSSLTGFILGAGLGAGSLFFMTLVVAFHEEPLVDFVSRLFKLNKE